MNWPQDIPEDLRKQLETVMGYRTFAPIDVWAAIKEWLESHDVPAPDSLPKPERRERFTDQ